MNYHCDDQLGYVLNAVKKDASHALTEPSDIQNRAFIMWVSLY